MVNPTAFRGRRCNDASMRATAVFMGMLRDRIGPALRAEGFTGSGTTWTLKAPNDDWAVVNAQSSSASTSDAVRFVINMAIVPEPWWSCHRVIRSARGATRAPKEYDGLWRDRLHPSRHVPHHGPEPWWLLRDEDEADRCGRDVVRQLTEHGVPRLRQLLDRGTLLATIRAGDFGFLHGDPTTALAVLLADEGPSTELDSLFSHIAEDPDERHRAHNADLLAWLRGRIAEHGTNPSPPTE